MSLLTLLGPRFGVLRARAGLGDYRDVGCEGGGSGSPVADTFNRADAGSLGTASDGGVWTEEAGGFSVISNKAGSNFAGHLTRAIRDLGTASATVEVTLSQGAFGAAVRIAWLWLGLDPVTADGYLLACEAGGLFQLTHYTTAGGLRPITPYLTGTSWSANAGPSTAPPTVLNVSWDAATASVTIVQDGVTVGTSTDPTPAAVTGGWVGIADANEYAASIILFDDYTATPVGTPFGSTTGRLRMQLPDGSWVREACDTDLSDRHPLRIEDPTNPGTWIDVACMVPV